MSGWRLEKLAIYSKCNKALVFKAFLWEQTWNVNAASFDFFLHLSGIPGPPGTPQHNSHRNSKHGEILNTSRFRDSTNSTMVNGIEYVSTLQGYQIQFV